MSPVSCLPVFHLLPMMTGFSGQTRLYHGLPKVLQPGVLHQVGLLPQGYFPSSGGECQRMFPGYSNSIDAVTNVTIHRQGTSHSDTL